MNFAPFADQTLLLLGSLDYDLNPNEVYLIRPYLDPASPDLNQLQESVRLERVFLKGIMSYSMEIVNLAESGMAPEEQVKSYKTYLSVLAESVKAKSLADVLISDEQIKTVFDAIAQKKTLLDAMQAARPLIIEFNKVNLRLIGDIGKSRTSLVAAVQQKIDEKFKGYVDFEQSLRIEKADVLQQLPSSRAKSEKYLDERLTLLTKRQEEIKPDLDAYRDLKGKLDQIQHQHDIMIRSGGRAVLAWSSAHQQMANGKIDRAEWFGLSDAKDMVTGAAKKAIP